MPCPCSSARVLTLLLGRRCFCNASGTHRTTQVPAIPSMMAAGCYCYDLHVTLLIECNLQHDAFQGHNSCLMYSKTAIPNCQRVGEGLEGEQR